MPANSENIRTWSKLMKNAQHLFSHIESILKTEFTSGPQKKIILIHSVTSNAVAGTLCLPPRGGTMNPEKNCPRTTLVQKCLLVLKSEIIYPSLSIYRALPCK